MEHKLKKRLTAYIRELSLPRKVLLPFFLILVLLGSAATLGATLLLKEAKFNTIDKQLHTFYKSMRQELVGQQQMLKGIAQMLARNDGLVPLESIDERLPVFSAFETIEPVNMEVRFIAIDAFAHEASPTLQMALVRSINQEAPLNTILYSSEHSPTIATLVPVGPAQKPSGVIVIQIDANAGFLSQLPMPDKGSVHLFAENGQVISSSSAQVELEPLSGSELSSLIEGGFLIKTVDPPFGQRIAFGSLTMMDRELYLAVALPLDDLKSLITVMTTRSALSILGALILGGIIYTLLIRSIMAPISELLLATEAVARGELNYRVSHSGGGEFGQLSESFNHMLSQLERLYRERLSHQNELALAAKELRHKDDIERKNAQIAQTNKELQSTIKDLSALFQCNQAMISTLDVNLLFDRFLTVLQDVLDCDELVLLLYEKSTDELTVRKVLGLDPDQFHGVTFGLDEGISGLVGRRKKPIYVEDLAADKTSLGYKGRVQACGSLLSLPMIIRTRLVGVLNLHKSAKGGFTESELKLAQAIANQAAIAIENAQLYEQTLNLSVTDELTGLANRRHFQEILERERLHADRFNSHFSVVMLDIDHFKKYNDSHGHPCGDTALKKVADLLLENTRGVDLPARYGGEEFILLLSQTDCSGALKAAEKIRLAIESTSFVGAYESQPGGKVTVSLGVATYPAHSRDLTELMNIADRALYRAKKKGRNRTEQIAPEERNLLEFSA